MKKTLIVILIIVVSVASLNYFTTKKGESITEKVVGIKKPKPIYHIKVQCWRDYYEVKFTNDNWETEENIMDAFDISVFRDEISIAHQLWLGKENDALILAKKLHSYQECLNYNEMIKKRYLKLYEFRKANPIKGQSRGEFRNELYGEKPKKECKPTEIY